MKMRLMTFNEACKTFGKKYLTKISFTDGYIFGIGKDSIPWGENVEVDTETFYDNDNLPTYKLNGFFVPTGMFKVDGEIVEFKKVGVVE